MLYLNNIASEPGSRKKSKRLWRWNGSWKWNYCWRWLNWQNCRSWGWVWPWFEWGQTSLFRRMPKLKWFSNAKFTVRYDIVNLSDLDSLSKKGFSEINKEVLLQNSLVKNKKSLIKVLWDWEISSKITLKVNKISSSALEKIKKAGWTVELV